MRLLALILAALPIGHSVHGQAIRPVVLGDPAAAHRMLVVGCIHGSEPAGNAIVQRLVRAERRPARRSSPSRASIPTAASAEPAETPTASTSTELPVQLGAHRRAREPEYSGPRPLSEPESRYAVGLIEAATGDHDLVPPAAGRRARLGAERATARRFASLARILPEHPLAVRHGRELAEPPVPRNGVVRGRAAPWAGGAGGRDALGAGATHARGRGSPSLAP